MKPKKVTVVLYDEKKARCSHEIEVPLFDTDSDGTQTYIVPVKIGKRVYSVTIAVKEE